MARGKEQLFPSYTDIQKNNSVYHFGASLAGYLLWLALAVAVLWITGIERNKGLDMAALIISGGFMIYILLPLRMRKLALLTLTFSVEAAITGPWAATGVLVVMLLFVAITYIPVNWLRKLAAALITVFMILVVLRVVQSPATRFIIMLAAIFLMLRYIFLLYELPFMKTRPVFIDRLCYLFMLPNGSFPLFPIVDPKIFLVNYYSEPAERSLQQGLTWITRGILHTLMYRCIYLYLTPSPYEIEGFWKLLLFIFSGYSLILRLSGIFYISLGFLALFGFSLPPIFDHYFFASGFPDLWRRINLYWRSFITRVFYYPTLFRLKKWPVKTAILVTTMLMFVCTWLLHAWQWFWIKGSYTFSPNDVLFWAILGTVISANAVLLLNTLNKKPAETGDIFFQHFVKGARVVVMLMAMSFLWTLWTSGSLTEFFYLLGFLRSATVADVLEFSVAIALLAAAAGCIRYLYDKKGWFKIAFSNFSTAGGIVFLTSLLAGLALLEKSHLKEETTRFLSNTLNAKDKMAMERGYYEQLLNNDDKAIELFNMGNLHKKWNLDNQAYRYVNNVLIKEFKPGYKTVFKGDSLSTNSFGLRDKEYSLTKKEGTVRIALLGGSYEMGSGVGDHENYATLLEDELNLRYSRCPVEIWNYGAGGYHLLQSVYQAERKVLRTRPDYLFYAAHTSEVSRCLDNMVNVIEKKLPLSFGFVDSLYRLSGIKPGMCRLEKYNRLKPYAWQIVAWGYGQIASMCKANNMVPVMIYLPANASLRSDTEKEFCLSTARRLGFTVIDLDGVYKGYDPEVIQLSLWDAHPNQRGHRLIAARLLREMLTKKQHFDFLK